MRWHGVEVTLVRGALDCFPGARLRELSLGRAVCCMTIEHVCFLYVPFPLLPSLRGVR